MDYSVEKEAELLSCKQDHLQWLHREEIMGCQKSRIKWISEGDLNTGFFHASLHVKKKTKFIDRMDISNGQVLEPADEVHDGAINFYKELLSTSSVEFDEEALELLSPVVSDQDI